MFESILSSHGSQVEAWIEYAALLIEVLAVLVIVIAILGALGRYTYQSIAHPRSRWRYSELRRRMGRALLLGLEILVAADIVRTVVLDPTLQSIAVLGLLVLIRTFLSWSLVVEIEGRWPWQPVREANEDNAQQIPPQ